MRMKLLKNWLSKVKGIFFSTNLEVDLSEFFYSDLPSLERCEAQLQTKVLLYFPNIQNMQISRILDILMNSETIKDRYCKTTYAREDDSGIGDRLERILIIKFLLFVIIQHLFD